MNALAYNIGHSVAKALGLSGTQANANAEFIGNTALAAMGHYNQLAYPLAAELLEALNNLIADIDDYENVNNLSPNPGHQECWQSVEKARLVADQAAKLLGEQKK